MMDDFIHGHPIPQGSVTPMPFQRKNGKLGVNTPQKKNIIEWRDNIARYMTMKHPQILYPSKVPCEVRLTFRIVRPKSSKLAYPTVRCGDLDKLTRAVLDALTGVIYADDSQVVKLTARKMYVFDESEEGVIIGTSHFAIDETIALPVKKVKDGEQPIYKVM